MFKSLPEAKRALAIANARYGGGLVVVREENVLTQTGLESFRRETVMFRLMDGRQAALYGLDVAR